MKSFKEHQDALEESVMRKGAVTSYAAQSRKYGDAAVKSYRRGQQALRSGGPTVDIEQRLTRIEDALDHLLDGLVKQRQQIGAGVAVDVAGHMLAAKEKKTR